VPGLGGAQYGAHAGLCLETQYFPNSPNHRHFTDSTLMPDDVYRHTVEYRFA
jgi:aldose 1-epimerase